jgi:hypothetical protein
MTIEYVCVRGFLLSTLPFVIMANDKNNAEMDQRKKVSLWLFKQESERQAMAE